MSLNEYSDTSYEFPLVRDAPITHMDDVSPSSLGRITHTKSAIRACITPQYKFPKIIVSFKINLRYSGDFLLPIESVGSGVVGSRERWL